MIQLMNCKHFLDCDKGEESTWWHEYTWEGSQGMPQGTTGRQRVPCRYKETGVNAGLKVAMTACITRCSNEWDLITDWWNKSTPTTTAQTVSTHTADQTTTPADTTTYTCRDVLALNSPCLVPQHMILVATHLHMIASVNTCGGRHHNTITCTHDQH